MVQIGIPIAFAIGQMIADASRGQLRSEWPEEYYRGLVYTNIYMIFCFAMLFWQKCHALYFIRQIDTKKAFAYQEENYD